jgi:hypothetical protein
MKKKGQITLLFFSAPDHPYLLKQPVVKSIFGAINQNQKKKKFSRRVL